MKRILALFLCLAMIFAFSVTAFAEFAQPAKPSAKSATWHIVGYSSGLVQYGDTFNNGGLYIGTDGNYWRYCSMTSGSCSGMNGYVASQYTAFG